jgi:hypothetical protein
MPGIVKLGEFIDDTEITESFFTLPQSLLRPFAVGAFAEFSRQRLCQCVRSIACIDKQEVQGEK